MDWLRKLFHRCEHKWKEVEQFSIIRVLDGDRIGTLYVLRCEKCGDMKRVRT